MKQYITLFVVFALLLLGCSQNSATDTNNSSDEQLTEVERIVQKAIEVSGGNKYLQNTTSFDFREMSYINHRDQGLFQYERLFDDDSLGNVRDVLNNDGFTRYIDGEVAHIPDSMAQKYTNSVNSVIYFAMLPYGLNDAAVNKELLEDEEFNGNTYWKVKVTFQQQGGGVDYQDVFIYWINQQSFAIDYFGYTYETEGGGVRFREAFNPQVINGIRFQDYRNYKPQEGDSTGLENYLQQLGNEKLELLSTIELTNIMVE